MAKIIVDKWGLFRIRIPGLPADMDPADIERWVKFCKELKNYDQYSSLSGRGIIINGYQKLEGLLFVGFNETNREAVKSIIQRIAQKHKLDVKIND